MKNKRRTKVARMDEEADDLENIDMNEVTDSEEEYSENERKLLKKVRERNSSESHDSDYEVYGLDKENEGDQDDEEGQTDSMESDIEGLQEDFDLPNEKAWGKKKRAYYSTDYVDSDYATVSQKDLADAELEEEEARNIQKRLAEQLDDADFGLDFVQSEAKKDNDEEVGESTEQFIKTDLSKLSKRQKQAMMQKESPEFVALVNDFKVRMLEARDLLAPFLKLVKSGIVPDSAAVSFVKTKYHLLLNYSINISFYLILKAKRLPVSSHPVIKRLAQYRQLINQLEAGQGNLIEDIKVILEAEKQGKPLYYESGAKVNVSKQRVSHFKENANNLTDSANDVEDADSLSSESEIESERGVFMNAEESVSKEVENKVEDSTIAKSEHETKGKRAITYQIAKNKGLTPHRKKEQRNPRVKHRNKYRKAKIRRKGAVREVRKELTRYGGEISGIKAGVKKSIKLK